MPPTNPQLTLTLSPRTAPCGYLLISNMGGSVLLSPEDLKVMIRRLVELGLITRDDIRDPWHGNEREKR